MMPFVWDPPLKTKFTVTVFKIQQEKQKGSSSVKHSDLLEFVDLHNTVICFLELSTLHYRIPAWNLTDNIDNVRL